MTRGGTRRHQMNVADWIWEFGRKRWNVNNPASRLRDLLTEKVTEITRGNKGQGVQASVYKIIRDDNGQGVQASHIQMRSSNGKREIAEISELLGQMNRLVHAYLAKKNYELSSGETLLIAEVLHAVHRAIYDDLLEF